MRTVGKITQDIEKREAWTGRAFGSVRQRLWRTRKIILMEKINIFDVIVVPVLLYAVTTWAVRQMK